MGCLKTGKNWLLEGFSSRSGDILSPITSYCIQQREAYSNVSGRSATVLPHPTPVYSDLASIWSMQQEGLQGTMPVPSKRLHESRFALATLEKISFKAKR